MAVGMADYEAAILPVKQALFQQLFASVGSAQQLLDDDSSSSGGPISLLEVGIGTGPNLSYLPLALTSSSSSTLGDLTVTGLDPNTSMFGYAREAAATAGLSPEQLRLVDGDAQAMPFESNSMDAAVMTLVLCSVQQPAAVLSELLRVLRPGGQLLIIEHVIASQAGLLQLQQRLFNPLQRLLADNCHLTRDTASVIRASGFAPQLLPPLPLKPGIGAIGKGSAASNGSSGRGSLDSGDILGSSSGGLPGGVNGSRDLWRFEVDGMGLIAPHVAGILTKPLL